MASAGSAREERALEHERWQLVQRLERWLETPMVILAFVWLGLFVLEFVRGEAGWVVHLGTAIWIAFSLDFLLRFSVAPRKLEYLKKNWLTALSLLVPALRVFRVVALIRIMRLARVARSLRLLRVFSSVNRGMRALGATMHRRGFGYVVLLTLVVTFVGAAGMLAFEKGQGGETGLRTYGQALWWTAMIITTMGTDYWPQTTEGRVLCFFLAVFAFAMFGYVTATLATFFIGRDAERQKSGTDDGATLALKDEIAALREELRSIRR